MASNPQLAGLLSGDPSLQNTLSGTDVQTPAQGSVEELFSQLQGQIADISTPATIPVPEAPGPIQAFAAQLAANLGSQLTQNPNIARQVSQQLQQLMAAPAEAEQFNAVAQNQANRTRLIQETQLTLRRIDSAMQAARAAGDLKRETDLLNTQQKHAEKLAKMREESDLAQSNIAAQSRIKAAEIAAGSREKVAKIRVDADLVRAQLPAPEEKGDPLDSSKFLTNMRQVAATFPGETTGLGIDLPGGGRLGQKVTLRITPQGANALVSTLIVGINNGDSFVRPTAGGMLARFLREQEGITDEDQILQRMLELGVDPAAVSLEDVPDR